MQARLPSGSEILSLGITAFASRRSALSSHEEFARTKRLWMLAALAGFALVSYMARANISIASELMMPALGLTKVQMGQIFTSFLLGYSLFQIPGGALGDRIGARLTLGFSAIIWALCTLLTGLVPLLSSARLLASFLALFVIRMILGISDDLPRFSQPTIAGVSRFCVVGEYISPPSSGLWRCGKRTLLSTSP